ncbi:MAG: hypothetical protein NW226_21115 [Microscillaceae bacterium]|nr:hypothetical protein [Microscillaceae bacterium]
MKLLTFFIFMLSLGLSLGIINDNAQAQAWTRKKGGGYAQLGFSNISANSLYSNLDDISEINLRREVTDNTLQFYGEYGLSDKFTLVTAIPFKLLETGNKIFSTQFFPDTLESGSLSALGNISIAGVYGLPQTKNWVASAKLRLDLNTASYDAPTGLRTGYDAWGLAPSLTGGYGSTYFFATAEVGVNLRINNYSHQFFSSLQAGVNYNQRIFLIAVLEILQSFENGDFNDENALHSGLYVNDLEFTAFQLKVGGYPTKNLGVWLSSGGGSSGNFVAKGRALTLAVSYQWNKK